MYETPLIYLPQGRGGAHTPQEPRALQQETLQVQTKDCSTSRDC